MDWGIEYEVFYESNYEFIVVVIAYKKLNCTVDIIINFKSKSGKTKSFMDLLF